MSVEMNGEQQHHTMRQPEFIIRDGVLYVSPWEWNSTETTLLGHPVHAEVSDEQRVPATSEVPESKIIADVHLTFPNGWVLALAPLFYETLRPGEYATTFVAPTIYWGQGRIVSDIRTLRLPNPTNAAGLIPVVEEVASRDPWPYAEPPNTPSFDPGEAFIAQYIGPHPADSGVGEYWLKEPGVPVWAVVGMILAGGRISTETTDAVAKAYHITREEVMAAWSYYLRHAAAINSRIAQNQAA